MKYQLMAISIISAGLLASPVTAQAKVAKSCDSVCADYRAASVGGDGSKWSADAPMSMAYVIQKCGPIPRGITAPGRDEENSGGNQGVADADRGISANFRSGNKAWDECYAGVDGNGGLRGKWNQTGPHCAAIQLNKAGRKVGITAASLYTTAAASCFTACALEKVPFAQGVKGLCIGTGIAATAADITGMITVAAKGEEEFSRASKFLDFSSLAGIGGSVATGASMAATGSGSEAGGKASSCVAGALFTLSASLKWANTRVMKKSAEKACENVQALLSDTTETDASGVVDPSKASSFVTADGRPSTGTASGGGTGGVVDDSYAAISPQVFEGWSSGQFANATAGPMDSLLGAISPVGAKNALEQSAKIDTENLVGKLDSESPGQILSSLPGLSPEMSQAIATIGNQALDGSLTLAGFETPVESGLMKSGSKIAAKPAAATTSPFGGLFGGSRGIASSGGGTGGEVSFEKIRQAIAPQEGGDIFHEGYTGSIFDLVSVKIGKNRERVEQLEWDTPLNRALVGLPAKKAQVQK